jgi:hypothetical protein
MDTNLKEIKVDYKEIMARLEAKTDICLGKMEARTEIDHEPKVAEIKNGLEHAKTMNLEVNLEEKENRGSSGVAGSP